MAVGIVATFDRKKPLGLILGEADAETTEMDRASLEQWKQAVVDAAPGDVFVQGIVPESQAAEIGVFAVGDRLQGVGELPLYGGGFEKAVEMVCAECESFIFDAGLAVNA